MIIKSDNLFFDALTSATEMNPVCDELACNSEKRNLVFEIFGEVLMNSCKDSNKKKQTSRDYKSFEQIFKNKNHIFELNQFGKGKNVSNDNADDYAIEVANNEVLNIPAHSPEDLASVSFSFKTHQPNQLLMRALLKNQQRKPKKNVFFKRHLYKGFERDTISDEELKYRAQNAFEKSTSQIKADPYSQFIAMEVVDGLFKYFC